MYIFDPSFFSNDAWKVAQKKRPIPYWYTKYITGYLQFKGFLFFTFDPVAKYSQLSIKPSVLLNDQVRLRKNQLYCFISGLPRPIFGLKSIKRPVLSFIQILEA